MGTCAPFDAVFGLLIPPVASALVNLSLLDTFKNWSLTLTQKHRLRVFENRVLRRIFGSKGDEVTGEWRRLHN